MQRHKINGRTYAYEKPDQVRDIPLKQCSVRGYIPSLKPHLKGCVWNYESQLERDFLYLLDHDPNCIDLQTQPIEISYTTKNGLEERIVPDVWAIFFDGQQLLFEIKTEEKLSELKENENWALKVQSITEYCQNHNPKWQYQIITESRIRSVRLNNIKDMLGSAKHYSPTKNEQILAHHRSRYQCDLCDYKSKDRPMIKRHKANVHNIDVHWHPCNLCDYKAKSANNLKQHKLHKHQKKLCITSKKTEAKSEQFLPWADTWFIPEDDESDKDPEDSAY